MTNLVTLAKRQFEAGLQRIVNQSNGIFIGFEEKNQFGTEEHVYVVQTKNPNADIKIYSSISKYSQLSRKKGADAIRCVIEYKGKEIYRGTSHTKRIQTWENNLQNKMLTLASTAVSLRHCPNCSSVLTERKGPSGKFLGCSAFPKCRHTEKV